MELPESTNTNGLENSTVSAPVIEKQAEETQNTERKSFKDSLSEKMTDTGEPRRKSVEKTQEKRPPILAPAGMDKAAKERFSKLSYEDQEYIANSYNQFRSDYGKQTQALRFQEQKIKPLIDILTPVEQELVKMGVKPEDLLNESISWRRSVAKDPKAAFREAFKKHNIDPIDFIDDDPGFQQPQQQPFDPVAYEQQITEKIMKQIQEKNLEEQKKVALQSSEAIVQKFMKAKPLFQDPTIGGRLEELMGNDLARQLAANPNQDIETLLEDSFNYFVNRVPEFSEIQKKLNAKAEADKIQSEADQARSAGRTISGGAHSSIPNAVRGLDFKTRLARNMGSSYD